MNRALIILLAISLLGCKTGRKAEQRIQKKIQFTPLFTPGQPTLVYKTKADYTNLVPVILSSDKSEIVHYPHPKDLKSGDDFLLPTKLKDGYLLDNKGIGFQVAFFNITYEAYAALEEAPSLQELYELILDKDPLIELCDCGNRTAFSDEVNQINKMIEKKVLRRICEVID